MPALDWRRVGNSVLDLGLASPAGGPLNRVWYSSDGQSLYVSSPDGRAWRSLNGEEWTLVPDAAPPPPARSEGGPEPGARVSGSAALYAAGRNAWKSEDGGAHWSNLTEYQGHSLLGGRLYDVAVSPVNPAEVAVAGETGVWRSRDGGASWAGMNEGLPNLPVARLLTAPDRQDARILTRTGAEVLWTRGERSGWRPAPDSVLVAERALLIRASTARGMTASAALQAGDVIYAGFPDGNILVSRDAGANWQESPRVAGSGSIVRIFADERSPAFAVAITSSTQRARVLRTVNGGAFWDDITADLPTGNLHGVTADRATGALYIAASAGLFLTWTDTQAAGPPTPWIRLRSEPARDVLLDGAGNQLYLALEGEGVFGAMAPHRFRDPRVVSAAGRTPGAVAPGALLSVLGARVNSAQAGDWPAPVLAAGDLESQVQLPYELSGTGVVIDFSSASGPIRIGLPVAAAAPSILVDKDGSPLIVNADTGLMLDAGSPARARTRVQVLASGLGRTTPAWPTGLPAPVQDPPRVLASVRAWLDREPLEVVRATLAPGYVGLYLVEFELPAILNRGPAELYLDAGGEASNRVQLWLEP